MLGLGSKTQLRDRARQDQTLHQARLARTLGEAGVLGRFKKAHRIEQLCRDAPVRQHRRAQLTVRQCEGRLLEVELACVGGGGDLAQHQPEIGRINGRQRKLADARQHTDTEGIVGGDHAQTSSQCLHGQGHQH